MSEAPALSLTGPEKAAVLLLSLGVERAAQVLQHLDEVTMEQVVLAMSRLGPVGEDLRRQVTLEASRLAQNGGALGRDFARELLSKALDPNRSAEILQRLEGGKRMSSLGMLRKAPVEEVAAALAEEPPQVIALVLSQLDAKTAADVLAHLPEPLQPEVALGMAQAERIPPEVLQIVEEGLRRKLARVLGGEDEAATTGGVDFLVKVMQQAGRGMQKTLLESLEAVNPQLAEEVRNRLFTFDDLLKLDDRSIQRLLRDVDKQDLTLALKGAPEELRDLIFRNMSERARENLKEEIELLGPQLARNVYAAQQRIVEVVRRLEEAEEIVIAGGGGGDEIIY